MTDRLTHLQKQHFILETAITPAYTSESFDDQERGELWQEILRMNAVQVNQQYSSDREHRNFIDGA